MKLDKITKIPRAYEDACAAAHALDLLGDRWALPVMRELMFGPRRFGDLRRHLPGLSANVLTQRLADLEAAGAVRRRRLEPPASVQVYELTQWGLEAEPILLALGRWGVRSPGHDPTLPISPVSLMLSFRAKFDPARAAGLDVEIGFQFETEAFQVSVKNGRLENGRGAAEQPAVRVATAPPMVAALVYGKVPMTELERTGAFQVDGDRRALQRFADIYELPPKAG